MKRATVIEADKPIPSQLRIIQFNDGSPYETLHALVSKAITPYFKSYVKESGRADRYDLVFPLAKDLTQLLMLFLVVFRQGR